MKDFKFMLEAEGKCKSLFGMCNSPENVRTLRDILNEIVDNQSDARIEELGVDY